MNNADMRISRWSSYIIALLSVQECEATRGCLHLSEPFSQYKDFKHEIKNYSELRRSTNAWDVP